MYNDEIRREAKDIDREHRSSMGGFREVLARLFGEGSQESGQVKADVVLGGLDRRRFMKVGGVSVLTAAVLAACGGDDAGEDAGATTSTTEGTTADRGDITILRTASSLEEVAVVVYQMAVDSGQVKTAAVADLAKLFQEHHNEHSEAFQAATRRLGGEPFAEANPAVLAQLKPEAEAAMASEASIIAFATKLEAVAAATYQASVGAFKDPKLGQTAMSVGGVEARHHAVLLAASGMAGSFPAFQKTDDAVAVGTGV